MGASKAAKKTKKCEHCGKNMNVRYSICPHCGGQQHETGGSLTPECPRCKVGLELLVTDDGEEYDICPQCNGVWLDRDEFRRATMERTVYRKVKTGDEYIKNPVRGPVEYIPCVRCGKLMNRRNFGKISGVIIDRCSKHGVWLDAGELEKIQHFIADGGLDRSRDREIAKNRAAIKELAINVDQNTFTVRLLHFWNFKRLLFRGWR
ncbi:MAG: zf-TFIIB domain-containing protein [Deferribacteres bacterium]|nr:zf-TFIIB domain-containing protein [Deferribacteres bacterium]